jgi:hypothetical protein
MFEVGAMVYCPKCGNKNEENAKFCNNCGTSLVAAPKDPGKEFEDKCERDCAGTPRSSRIFWAVILLLVGLWVIFEFGLKNIQGLPSWLTDFQFWWIIPVVIGIAIIIAAIRMMTRREHPPGPPGYGGPPSSPPGYTGPPGRQ